MLQKCLTYPWLEEVLRLPAVRRIVREILEEEEGENSPSDLLNKREKSMRGELDVLHVYTSKNQSTIYFFSKNLLCKYKDL